MRRSCYDIVLTLSNMYPPVDVILDVFSFPDTAVCLLTNKCFILDEL